jgi:hypothetical protein
MKRGNGRQSQEDLIHSRYELSGVASGVFSSSKPKCSSYPKEKKDKAIISRARDGRQGGTRKEVGSLPTANHLLPRLMMSHLVDSIRTIP